MPDKYRVIFIFAQVLYDFHVYLLPLLPNIWLMEVSCMIESISTNKRTLRNEGKMQKLPLYQVQICHDWLNNMVHNNSIAYIIYSVYYMTVWFLVKTANCTSASNSFLTSLDIGSILYKIICGPTISLVIPLDKPLGME